jgi:alkanesulfonate monooxygenase SsuD/methylene tetrahydromethanopterin reductase-like flavin-dependent oxidoreductase (luciferase family)
VRFGYIVGQDVPSGGDPAAIVHEAVVEAKVAAEAGFDGVFVTEHHGAAMRYLPGSIPLMFLLAHAAPGIDIGAAVLLLSLAQPTRAAEELALLDHLTGGRVILGAGAGYLKADFDAFGVEQKGSGRLLDEALGIMRRLWNGETVDFDGRAVSLRGATIFPLPVQAGGPPIWIGGRSPRGVARAAEVGDVWVLDATPRRSLFLPWRELYLEELEARGRTPRTAILRDAWLSLGERLDEEYRAAALASHRAKIAAGVYHVDPKIADRAPESVGFDELAEERWLVGDAASIQSELDAWEDELGIDYVLLRFRTQGRPSHEAAVEQLRSFGEAVIAPRRNGLHRQSSSTSAGRTT